MLQVEGFSRKASLGVKLEQKAVKLGLLPAPAALPAGGSGGGLAVPPPAGAQWAEGPITRYVQHAVGKFLAAKRSRCGAGGWLGGGW